VLQQHDSISLTYWEIKASVSCAVEEGHEMRMQKEETRDFMGNSFDSELAGDGGSV
jgi:hypothetical protein